MSGRKIKLGKNINYMMGLVEDFISGKTPRYIFELDFQTEIMNYYKKMAREDRELAEYFYDMISAEGVDAGDKLSDAEFKELIRSQYKKVKNAMDDGLD